MSELQSYLLAAGNGTRAGGPKAWQPFEAGSLMDKQLGFLVTRFEPENVTVTIQDGWQERCSKISKAVNWVVVDPKDPPMASIIAALKAKPMRQWSFLHHVDQPVWEPKLFDILENAVEAADQEGLDAIAPSFHDKKGHPILLSPHCGSALVTLDPKKDRLDAWLRNRREGTVEVPFACIHENWNTPRQVG